MNFVFPQSNTIIARYVFVQGIAVLNYIAGASCSAKSRANISCFSQFSQCRHTSNDQVTTNNTHYQEMSGCDMGATKLVTRLTMSLLLCIDPSDASDKSNTMLIAPSYTQNPLLRKIKDKLKKILLNMVENIYVLDNFSATIMKIIFIIWNLLRKTLRLKKQLGKLKTSFLKVFVSFSLFSFPITNNEE